MVRTEGLKYTREHNRIRIDDAIDVVGITDFAQRGLAEMVYGDLPNKRDEFNQDQVCGSVEALKTVGDLYIPISGEIVQLHESRIEVPLSTTNLYQGAEW